MNIKLAFPWVRSFDFCVSMDVRLVVIFENVLPIPDVESIDVDVFDCRNIGISVSSEMKSNEIKENKDNHRA